ncbi:two-component regulator propeller domain-containing protein [Sphingobacterium sp. LRF_L2]|uniref:two-component regulator propeller domain-containing protein n=1 Tax=Sphingobacterium sp. LRF_L2 TaxID=3369421 RepID=UPI003F5D8CDC
MRRLFLFIILLQGMFAVAQSPKAKYLGLQDGLSNQQVLDVVHDDQGFVWIATELGLNRFASNSFKTYYESEKQDGTSVNSSEINTLFYDDHKLYVGTRSNGLNVLDLQTNHFSYFLHHPEDKNSIATNDITDIIKSKDGHLWLTTYHQGVQRFNPDNKRFETFNKKKIPTLPENSCWTLVEDESGLLYIGHVNEGMSIFNRTQNRLENLNVENTKSALPNNEVKALFCDRKGNIWIGTRKGIAVYSPYTKSIQFIPLAGQAKNQVEPFVYSIKEVGDDLWIGAASSQLFILKPSYNFKKEVQTVGSPTVFDLARGTNTSVQHISPDQFGNVWLALYGGGIGFIGHLKSFFNVFPRWDKDQQATRLATVSGILTESDQISWLATEGDGLVQMGTNGDISRHTTHNSAIPDNFLLSAFSDHKQNKWFGLQKGGVAILDKQTNHWRELNLGERVTEVRSMMQDTGGKIWIAAQQGVFVYDPEKKTVDKILINKSMLGDYAPRALLQDGIGNVWVGTYGQGLYVYDSNYQLLRKMSTKEGLKSNTINHLFKDNSNNIWVATNEGLALQSVNKEMGELEQILPPATGAWHIIDAVAQDRNGNIWCSTKCGLLRYLPEEKRFLSYDQSFGLPLGGFINGSVAMDTRGRLYFGMQEGLCFFDPVDVPLKLTASPVRLARFVVFNAGEANIQSDKYPSNLEKIQLQYNENSFRIELAVMDYAMDDLMEFSYKLQGLDDDWIFIGNEKNLDFRNIPFGDYELRIRTRLKNGEWSGEYKRLLIKIKPPFYWSNMAIVFYIVLGLAIIYVLVLLYVKRIKAESELQVKEHQHGQDQKLYTERLNFYTNITHELRTPLTLILGPLDDLVRDSKLTTRNKKLVHTVQKSANRLFSLVNQLLEFRKVESQYKTLVLGEGSLEEMLRDIVQKHAEANTNKEIVIDCDLPEKNNNTVFDGEIVQLIFDNLLANAYKYTEKGCISVKLQYEEDRLTNWAIITVSDTGIGIPAPYLNRVFDKFYQVPQSTGQGTGIGLALVKELVAIHHGKISVQSEEGEGTIFTVRLLTNKSTKMVNESERKQVELEEVELTENQNGIILLVEDDADLRNYLAETLRTQYEVIEASNGAEGFISAKARIPDIIISDVMMPDIDGFQLLTQLKQERETSHIPFIFLTAKDTELDRERGYELGSDSYLTKPVTAQLLFRRIDNLLLKRKILYTELLQQLSSQEAVKEEEHKNSNHDMWRENVFVQDFVTIVEEHIQDEVLDAATLAERMNMSQSTLYRKLKGITGKNINQLVRKVRIHKAAELLRSGNYNVTEVSFMVGINSAIYFRQCFKEEFDQLPSEYQKNFANKP